MLKKQDELKKTKVTVRQEVQRRYKKVIDKESMMKRRGVIV